MGSDTNEPNKAPKERIFGAFCKSLHLNLLRKTPQKVKIIAAIFPRKNVFLAKNRGFIEENGDLIKTKADFVVKKRGLREN